MLRSSMSWLTPLVAVSMAVATPTTSTDSVCDATFIVMSKVSDAPTLTTSVYFARAKPPSSTSRL